MITKKLTLQQKILVAGTLFGMFFGAGNLIFPVHLGQMAGRNVLPAMIGFIITAVGIPIFGVAAIGATRVLYVPSVPDHRTALCHPPLRNDVFYHRRDADADGRLARAAGASDFLGSFLCVCPVLLAQTR